MSAVACRHCGQKFTPTRVGHDHCSKTCQNRAWHASRRVERPTTTGECLYCEAEMTMNPARNKRYCSRLCKVRDWRLRAAEAVS